MDEVADTLMRIAIAFPGMDPQDVLTRSAAQITLVRAGLGEGGLAMAGKEARGVPYAGAASRLRTIAESAHDIGIRAGALRGLVQVEESHQYLPFLRQVATSQNAVAWVAVTMLAEETGPAGHAIARELYRQNLVNEPTAREMLTRAASAHRWR
jgi:hypothetical protein